MRFRNYSLAIVSLLCSANIYAAVPGSTSASAPASPSNLSVTADETGVMKVYISFDAPTKTVSGDDLTSLSRIEVRRDGATVSTQNTVVPGQKISITDTQVKTGYSTYTVTAFSSEEGETATAPTVFVGVDEPLPPAKFTIKDEGTQLVFTWSKSAKTGKNGERVNQNTVKYYVEELNESYSPTKVLSESNGQTATIFLNTTKGEQDIRRYSVYASNSAGESDRVYGRVVTGSPYYLPYSESFAGGVLHGLGWQSGDGDVILTIEDSSDNDAGCLILVPPTSGEFSFNLGKFDVTNVVNPKFSFRYKGLGEGEKILLRMARPDGAEGTIATIEGPAEDWTLFTTDLTKAAKNTKYIIPKLQVAEGNQQSLYIDDINVTDPYQSDLSVFVTAPESTGVEASANIIVTNEGLSDTHDAKVLFYVNGKQTQTFEVKDGLKLGESQTFEAKFNVSEETLGTSIEAKAQILWVYDLNPLNDIASAEIMYNDNDDSRGETSGVTEITDIDFNNAEIYTVNGLKIESSKQLVPGFYIINGRKALIK